MFNHKIKKSESEKLISECVKLGADLFSILDWSDAKRRIFINAMRSNFPENVEKNQNDRDSK